MRNLFSTKVKIILVVAALLTAALAIYSGISNQSLPSVIVQGVLAPFRAAGTTLTNTAEKYYSYMFRYEALDAENKVLEERIAQMEDVARQADSVSRENERLRKLLELRSQRNDLTFEAARITQRDVSNWSSTLMLNRGSRHGVAENDCAVDCYGNLVGVVTEVGLNWCRLTTILDTGSQLGAMVFRTEETAIAAGDLTLMTEGKLKLSYLPDSSTLIKGDLVVTSGLGGYYPFGLPIGSVEEVRTDDGGLARYAVLTPRCELDTLTDLYIVTDFDVVE